MKTLPSALLALGLLTVAGCSSPTSRIDEHRTAFDSWPAAAQEKVRAGRVDVGFTAEQVRVALGEPDRKSTRMTEHGTSEVWLYAKRGPRFSFGVGVGSGSYSGGTSYGGGVHVASGGRGDDEMLRVIFDEGRVATIEERRK